MRRQRGRDRVPEDYEAAGVEGLERAGIVVVDLASVPGISARPLEGLDRPAALRREREAGPEQLVTTASAGLVLAPFSSC